MESGLSESQAASGLVKINAGLPLPVGVAHNAWVISKQVVGVLSRPLPEALSVGAEGVSFLEADVGLF